MRIYGRQWSGPGQTGTYKWVVIETAPNGDNTQVYLTWLCQCLLLNLGESPFYANWGIPAPQSVIQQIAPDTYVSLMQQRFAQFFASLIITRQSGNPPTYKVNVTTIQGAVLPTISVIPT
jgi:hypothetical protein